MVDEDQKRRRGQTADELSVRLSDQLELLSDEDEGDWSSTQRAERLWLLAVRWAPDSDLLDAVAVLAARTKVPWMPEKGVYDGLARLAYPQLDRQRRSELIRALSSIDAVAEAPLSADDVTLRLTVLRRMGGVDQATRKKESLSSKKIKNALKRAQRARDDGA